MWNDIPADELKQLMEEIDAVELHPDELELERWLENQLSYGTRETGSVAFEIEDGKKSLVSHRNKSDS